MPKQGMYTKVCLMAILTAFHNKLALPIHLKTILSVCLTKLASHPHPHARSQQHSIARAHARQYPPTQARLHTGTHALPRGIYLRGDSDLPPPRLDGAPRSESALADRRSRGPPRAQAPDAPVGGSGRLGRQWAAADFTLRRARPRRQPFTAHSRMRVGPPRASKSSGGRQPGEKNSAAAAGLAGRRRRSFQPAAAADFFLRWPPAVPRPH